MGLINKQVGESNVILGPLLHDVKGCCSIGIRDFLFLSMQSREVDAIDREATRESTRGGIRLCSKHVICKLLTVIKS